MIVIGGVGMTFTDVHALATIDDAYRVAVAVVDERRAIPAAAVEVADELAKLPPGDLRVIGHSFGAAIATLAVQDLADRGLVGPGARFPRVLLVAMDGPWRGLDLPIVFLLPGIRKTAGWLVKGVPSPKPANDGTLSIVNRGSGMDRFHHLALPPAVTVQLVTVLGHMDTPSYLRELEPVADWYSAELGAGELKRLWTVLQSGDESWNAYDTWAIGGLVRKQGLQNLERAIAWDADWPAVGRKIRQAALESKTLEEFRARYDALLPEAVDTFHGHHTRFMWEDPSFLPYIRRRLAAW